MSNCSRPQVGQAISTGPRSRSFSALRISHATLTSSSAWKVDSEMRIVSPIPSASSVPRPTADFSEPDHLVPASVTPRCSGYGIRSDSSRLAAIVFGTEVDFIETLKSLKSRRSISSTVSTAAVTSASTGLSYSSWRRCLGSDPELTPTRSGVPSSVARRGDLGHLVGPADVSGVQAHAVRARVKRLQRQRVVEVDVGDHRDRRLLDDRAQRLGVLVTRDGNAHDVGAGLGDAPDLGHRGGQIGRLGLGHRLHGDGRPAADRHVADVDLPLGGHEPSVESRPRYGISRPWDRAGPPRPAVRPPRAGRRRPRDRAGPADRRPSARRDLGPRSRRR